MTLTPEQQRFVDHDPVFHARMLAGPGTGKSFTSVAYLEYISKEHSSLRVRYITFTRAATKEFAEALGDSEFSVLGGQPPSTVHGFALGQLLKLKSTRIPYPLRIPDSWETKALIQPHLSLRLKQRGFVKATPTVIKQLEREMSAGFETLDEGKILLSDLDPELRSAYLGAWAEHRQRFGYTLLSELTYRAGDVLDELLDGSAEIDLIIVDEYQDLNKADLRLLRVLADHGASIVAIGDDDQSIYSWRMAAPDGIRNFVTDYGTDKDYTLSVSRRCGPRALKAANDLILRDPGRPAKTATTASPDAPDTAVHYLHFKTSATEAAEVAQIIASRRDAGVALDKIAVFARSSISDWASLLQPELEKYGITAGVALDVGEALSQPGLRRALAIAHLVVDRSDSLAWWTLLHLTPRVGPTFINAIYDSTTPGTFSEKLRALYAAGFPDVSGSKEARAAIDRALATLNVINLDAVELREGGWGEWLLNLASAESIPDEVQELVKAVGSHLGPEVDLPRFFAELEPLSRELAAGGTSGVKMMTIAQSKGLTVDTAIVMGAQEGIIPHPTGEPAEEIRLLYVAMTRAKQLTVLTWASQRQGPTARHGRARTQTWERRESCELLTNVLSAERGEGFAARLESAADR